MPDVTQERFCGLGFAIRTSTISIKGESSLTYWENKSCKPSNNYNSSGNTTTISIFLKQHKGTWRMPWL
jgi:hypothetical protein